MDILTAVLIGLGMGAFIGALLGYASTKFKVEGNPLVEEVDRLLPQTQCGQCGYPGCKPYAEALVEGDDINKCVPGGEATMQAIADLLGRTPQPLDASKQKEGDTVVYIREAECIGCTKCIQACPVDAIVGAAKHMHTVLEDVCTGCDLCIPVCPVDCIEVRPARHLPSTSDAPKWRQGDSPIEIIPVKWTTQ